MAETERTNERTNERTEEDAPSNQHGQESRFTERMTRLIRAGNRLAACPTIDELCRQAVSTGLAQLGFERMSIWLVDNDRKQIRGTFGTDERGVIRDERDQSREWSDRLPELNLLDAPQLVFRNSGVPLRDDRNEVVGMGDMGAAALWNGEDVIGLLYADNLLSQQPIDDDQWRIFELYAATLGHLLSLKRTEVALRSNEEMLAQILDIMPVGVFVLTNPEKIAHFNRAAQELWEFEPETIEAWSPEGVWVDDRRPVAKDEWAGRQALWYGKHVLNQEVEVLRADGSRRVVLNSGIPLRDLAGHVTGAVVVNQDITVSKRREQQLQALATLGHVLRPLSGSREVLRAIVDSLVQIVRAQGVAVVLATDGPQAVVEAAAAAYAPLEGFVFPEAWAARRTGSSEVNVVDTDQQDSPLFAGLERSPRYCVVAPLVTEGSPIGAILLGFDEQLEDDTLALVRSVADVCATAILRGHLHDEVTTQAYRLERVMESANFGLVMLDAQQRVVLANQHAREKLAPWINVNVALGEELKEIAGQKLARFLAPANEPARTQEVSMDGAIFEVSSVPVGASGVEGGWLLVIHDITRERAIQSRIQQHQRLAAVGQLAAGIAHDFNNIVAVITLYVQMIQRNPLLDEGEHKRLEVIREQAQYASKLIRQILDFSRQTVIERQPMDLVNVIQQSIDLWQRTLPENITFTFASEMEGPATVLAEASSIQQALTNLAVNARDAMPTGGELRILLRAVRVGQAESPPVEGLKAGEWIALQVTDNGEGIAPEHLPHIFDPFFTTKEVGKGTGLGLAQVYGIVQQHGGMVTAHSAVGKGTTITLYLPAVVEQAAHIAVEDSLDEGEEGSETILLVEDNAPAREATSALLEMMGYRVIAASDGRQGLELYQQHRDAIQMVLSDIVMPGMSGVELYRAIHAQHPTVRMLLMTGYALGEDLQEFAADGRVEWLEKPFTVKELTLAVRRVLERAKYDSEDRQSASYSSNTT